MDHTNFSNNENVKLVQRWVDASNAHNPELKARLCTLIMSMYLQKYEVQQIIADGDCVVAKLRMTGTQSGPFRFEGMHSLNDPIPVSNKPIDIPTCSLFYIKDEKIILLERYWDSATLLRQIGVIDKW